MEALISCVNFFKKMLQVHNTAKERNIPLHVNVFFVNDVEALKSYYLSLKKYLQKP